MHLLWLSAAAASTHADTHGEPSWIPHGPHTSALWARGPPEREAAIAHPMRAPAWRAPPRVWRRSPDSPVLPPAEVFQTTPFQPLPVAGGGDLPEVSHIHRLGVGGAKDGGVDLPGSPDFRTHELVHGMGRVLPRRPSLRPLKLGRAVDGDTEGERVGGGALRAAPQVHDASRDERPEHQNGREDGSHGAILPVLICLRIMCASRRWFQAACRQAEASHGLLACIASLASPSHLAASL